MERYRSQETVMLFSRRRNNFAIAGLIVYAGALVAVVMFFILNQISRAEIDEVRSMAAVTLENAHRHTGTVVIPASVSGRCRHLAFDNTTGALREGTTRLCPDDGATTGNSTQGRMSAIRDSFAKR
jgi:hypothetical protein